MTSTEQTTPKATARCPRCGYDQRGIVATWIESCPVEGTCAEGGLQFHWAEVLKPITFGPRWCVEYAPTRRAFPRAVLTTGLRSCWPWAFWSRIRMSHEIRGRRLVAYVVLLFLLMIAGYVLEQSAVAPDAIRQKGRHRSVPKTLGYTSKRILVFCDVRRVG